jgi:hypothetical protein
MKRLILVSVVCAMLSALISCAGSAETQSKVYLKLKDESEKENATKVEQDAIRKESIYTISGEHRDKNKYLINEAGKMIFPKGKITKIIGSTSGTREQEIVLSEQEVGELITVLERDAIVATNSEQDEEFRGAIVFSDRNAYGQMTIQIETASKDKQSLIFVIDSGDIVRGITTMGKAEQKGVSFELESYELAEELREKIDFQMIDLARLDNAVSAKFTSIYNAKTVAITGETLKLFIKAIQEAKKATPPVLTTDYFGKAVVLEISLTDGTIIQGMFIGHGDDGFAIEAEFFEPISKSMQFIFELFKENKLLQELS